MVLTLKYFFLNFGSDFFLKLANLVVPRYGKEIFDLFGNPAVKDGRDIGPRR